MNPYLTLLGLDKCNSLLLARVQVRIDLRETSIMSSGAAAAALEGNGAAAPAGGTAAGGLPDIGEE